MSLKEKLNQPLSIFSLRLLETYLKFPEGETFTALDWRAYEGEVLQQLTRRASDPVLYGVTEDKYDCEKLRDNGFHKVSQANYRSEAKITNDSFSLMYVEPHIDERLVGELFDQIDPYNMPNFEEEVRAKVMRDEEERLRIQQELSEQIDFGELNEDNSEKQEEETPEERQEKLQQKIRAELEKRVKTWRLAMKEQQRKMSLMRWDSFLLQRAVNYIKPGGILIMVTPKELIDDSISFKLVNQFEDIRIIRLEDDAYLDTRKCIVIAKKRNKPTRDDYELGKLIARTKERPYKTFGVIRPIDADPAIDEEKYRKQIQRAKLDEMYSVLAPQPEPLYIVPTASPEDITSFRVGPITGPEALASFKKSKLIQNYQEKYSQTFTNKEPVTPTPLHKGHIMLLLTSGFLNGYIGTGPDQHLVKGSAIKDVREFTETEEDGTTRIVEREYYNIGVKILMASGEFKTIM